MLQYPGIASHAHPPEAAYRLCQPSCSRNVLRNRLIGCAGEATEKCPPCAGQAARKVLPEDGPPIGCAGQAAQNVAAVGRPLGCARQADQKGLLKAARLRGPVGSKSVPQERPIDCVGQVAPQIYAEASPGASQSLVVYSAATDEKTCLL